MVNNSEISTESVVPTIDGDRIVAQIKVDRIVLARWSDSQSQKAKKIDDLQWRFEVSELNLVQKNRFW